jgi:hypothetical protein
LFVVVGFCWFGIDLAVIILSIIDGNNGFKKIKYLYLNLYFLIGLNVSNTLKALMYKIKTTQVTSLYGLDSMAYRIRAI